MTYLTVEHKVKDYRTWKDVFDEFEDTRRSGGEKTYRVTHTENDPNNLVIFFEWETPDKARNFFKSDDLKDAMQRAGVVDKPKINFLKFLDEGKL